MKPPLPKKMPLASSSLLCVRDYTHRVKLFRALRRGIRSRVSRKTAPVLVIPLTRGPIQGFYHFFFGYFVPIYWRRMLNPREKLVLMALTPFNHWFPLLPGDTPKIIDQAKTAQNALLAGSSGYSRRYRVEAISYWDKWEKFPSRPLRQIATQIHQDLAERTKSISVSRPEIVVLGRGHIPEFYAQELGTTYGAARRDIANISEVVTALSQHYAVELLDGAAVNPEEVFVKCHSARLLLGQHGAGLSNVFFLKPGAAMIEIVWAGFESNAHINIYGPLCDELGVRWSRPVLQVDPYSEVPIDALISEVEALLPGQ